MGSPEYDKNGNPKKVEHRDQDSGSIAAIIWTNTFDDQGGLTLRQASSTNVGVTAFYGTERQNFDYDDLGRLVKAIDHSPASVGPDIAIENLFDTGGRLLREEQQFDPTGNLVSHTVDSEFGRDGFRTSLTFPDSGLPVRYALTMNADTLGRLIAINEPVSGLQPPPIPGSRELLRYEYLGRKPWMRRSGNGLEAKYFDSTNAPLYDHVGRSLGVRYVDRYGTSPDVAEFRYGYDRVGSRTYEQRRHEPLTDPAGSFRTRTFKSDLQGRLQNWREGALTANHLANLRTDADPTDNPANASDAEEWSLDRAGNWLTHSTGTSQNPPTDAFVPNDLNQYTQVTIGGNVKPFTFDWLGQLRQDNSKAQPQRYEWDMFGRLTRVIQVSNSAEIARYRYDAFNRRVEKTSASLPDLITRYVYDGWRSIEERAVVGSTEQVRARYGFGVSIDEVVWMDRASQGGENPPIDKRYFFAQDAIGSVIAATEDRIGTGALSVAERYTYSAYGEFSVWAGAWSASGYTVARGQTSMIGMPFAFTGQRYDPETGLHYFKNRYYDPADGKFLGRDPRSYAEGPNLYEYASSNPVLKTDPLGLASDEYRALHSLPGDSETRLTAPSAVADISARHKNHIAYSADLARRRVDGARLDDKEKRDLEIFLSEGRLPPIAAMLLRRITRRYWTSVSTYQNCGGARCDVITKPVERVSYEYDWAPTAPPNMLSGPAPFPWPYPHASVARFPFLLRNMAKLREIWKSANSGDRELGALFAGPNAQYRFLAIRDDADGWKVRLGPYPQEAAISVHVHITDEYPRGAIVSDGDYQNSLYPWNNVHEFYVLWNTKSGAMGITAYDPFGATIVDLPPEGP